MSTTALVALDLSRVPFMNADSMNMVTIIRKMDLFETRLAEIEQCYVRDKSATTTSVEVRSTSSGHVAELDITNGLGVSELSDTMAKGEGLVEVDGIGGKLPWNEVASHHRPAKPYDCQPSQKGQRNSRKWLALHVMVNTLG